MSVSCTTVRKGLLHVLEKVRLNQDRQSLSGGSVSEVQVPTYQWRVCNAFFVHKGSDTNLRSFVRGSVQKFPDWVIKKYTLTTINTRWEATQRVMAAKLTRLTHKIPIQLYLVAESCTICSSCSRRPVRKLLDTHSYICKTKNSIQVNIFISILQQHLISQDVSFLEVLLPKLHKNSYMSYARYMHRQSQNFWFNYHNNIRWKAPH
jgi:hypothetical protein